MARTSSSDLTTIMQPPSDAGGCHSIYRQAEPLYLKALELADQVLGPNDLEVSVISNDLAVLYKYTGNYDAR